MKRRKFFKSVVGTSAALSLMNTPAFAKPDIRGKEDNLKIKDNKMYDVIVIGVGSMGSATCYYLSNKGAAVLGLEQFGISHDRGSHAGQSRIIRKAYFEHPDYVPLLERAYKNWHKIQDSAGFQLYHPTGLAYFGKKEHELLQGVRVSASKYNIAIDELNFDQAEKKFPQFNIPSGYEMIFEQEAGFVTPEKTIFSLTQQAIQKGAVINNGETVLSWELKNGTIQVKTDKGSYSSGKLVICSGAYTSSVVPEMKSRLKVTRQLIAWTKPKNWEAFSLGNFPCWGMTTEDSPGLFYGFPILPIDRFQGPVGLKVAHHFEGESIDPSEIHDFDEKTEVEKLRNFLEEYIPEAMESLITVKSCLYTYSPDENFIIDYLPGYNEKVSIACGFSGHGFKFVPVVGEILADMAVEGKTDQPIEFLSLNRF